MKPLKLKIKGLNSFTKEQTIDFEALSACGIFGIFGPTGSGKSTILDGITLALYGDVARKSSNFVNSSEEIREAGIVFTFQISGNVPRIYQVERRYKKNKDVSKKPASQSVLKEITGGTVTVLEDGTSAVTAACERLIGLKKEDFLRTVVLPQGKFSEFLMLTGKERNEMLERLFHLEQYGESLAVRIAGEKKRLSLEMEHLAGQLAGYGGVSEESLKEQENALMEEKREEELLEERLAGAERAQEALRQVWTVQGELKQYQAELEQWKSRGADVDAAERSVHLAEEAGTVMPAILQVRQKEEQEKLAARAWEEAKKALSRAREEETEAQKRADEAAAGEAELEQLREKKFRLETAIPKLIERRGLEAEQKENREKLEALKERIQEMEERRRREEEFAEQSGCELESARRKLEENQIPLARQRAVREGVILENEAAGAAGAKENAERELSEKRREALSAEAALQKSRESLAKAERQEDEARRELQALQEQETVTEEGLRQLFEELQVWKKDWEEGRDCRRQEEENQADCLKLQKERKDAEEEKTRLEKAGAALDEAIREARRAERKKTAEALRKTLRAGEPCPVCGSIHFNLEAFEREETKRREREQRSLEELESEREKNRSRSVIVERRLAEKQAAVETARDAGRQIRERFERIPPLHRQQEPPMERYDKAKAARSAYQDQAEKLRKNAETAQAEAGRARTAVSEAETACRLRREWERDAEEKWKLAVDSCSRTAEALLQKRRELDISNFAEEEARIAEKEDRAEKLRKQIAQIEQDRAAAAKRRDETAAALTQAAENQIRLEAALGEIGKKIERVICEIASAAGNSDDPEKEAKDTERRILQIQENSKRAKEELSAKRDSRHQAELREEAGSVQAVNAGRASDDARAYFENMISGCRGLKNEMEARALDAQKTAELFLLSKEELEALSRKIEQHREEGKRLENLMAEREKRLGGQRVTEEEWKKAGEERGTASRFLEEKKAVLVLLEGRLRDERQRLGEKAELEKEQEKHAHRKALVEQLEKLVKGKRFVEYAAREKLQYISREASVLLRQLTYGTYQLECSPEGRFMVIDYKNGGVRRAVNTLSGGEVFLASLALALALSNQIQLTNQAPLELFFLDEGFGTLDDSLLDTVMDALENLRSLNRRAVGIITHVEKIQDQIPVKLIVKPGETGKRGSEVELAYS